MRYLRWLLLLIPVAILVELLHWSEVLLFIISALAVIPLAGLMGESTGPGRKNLPNLRRADGV